MDERMGGAASYEIAGSEPGLLGQTRKKLIRFLELSASYDPEKMLARFPFTGTPHARTHARARPLFLCVCACVPLGLMCAVCAVCRGQICTRSEHSS
jgi:hypothetical protein